MSRIEFIHSKFSISLLLYPAFVCRRGWLAPSGGRRGAGGGDELAILDGPLCVPWSRFDASRGRRRQTGRPPLLSYLSAGLVLGSAVPRRLYVSQGRGAEVLDVGNFGTGSRDYDERYQIHRLHDIRPVTRVTHVRGWEPAVCISHRSQNFRLFYVSNLFVLNFKNFLLMYPESQSGRCGKGRVFFSRGRGQASEPAAEASQICGSAAGINSRRH